MLTEADLVDGEVWSLGPRPGNWASRALGDTEGCEFLGKPGQVVGR